MPKTIASMKKRLEQALQQADEAEEIVDLLKQVIATYQIQPGDLFTSDELERAAEKADQGEIAAYIDEVGNTWSGRGRRRLWLVDALADGAALADFRNPRYRG